jgi:hypothetical protein
MIKQTVKIIVGYHCYQFHNKILWNIFSRLSPYIGGVIEDHQCGFRCNRATTAQIFSFRQILEKKWDYYETVHQLFIDFRKAYDSVRREVLYNILIEFKTLTDASQEVGIEIKCREN